MTIADLNTMEYNTYYQTYIDKVDHTELVSGLISSNAKFSAFLEAIPEAKFDFAYAEGKWTIKEVVQHIIDTERVFSYRAMCIARKEQVELPGFDQDDYVLTSNANERTKQSLLNELRVLRQSSVALFDSLSNDALQRIGTANGNPISVRALGFILIGHENHHSEVIKERYL